MFYQLPNVRAVIFRPRETLTSWLAKQTVKPYALINASLYDMQTREPTGTIVENSLFVHNDGNGFGFGYNKDGWYFGEPWDKLYTEYLTGYNGMVQGGKYVAPTWIDKFGVFTSFLNRIGIGQKNGVLRIYTADGSNLHQFADNCINQGADDVINLDGGKSRFLYINGRTIYSSVRVPYNAIAFYKLDAPANVPIETSTTVKKKVCLDAGHGKAESYNQSPDGTYQEYEFTFDMANRIKTLLSQNGIDTLMTRTDDSTPSLQARCDIANAAKCDLYVSIHSNASASGWSNASGLSVFTYATGGERDRAAQALLNEATSGGVRLLSSNIYHTAFSVLKNTFMPAYLIEYGFHTNAEEVELLKSSAYRAKLAEITAKAIVEYFGIVWKEEAPVISPPTATKVTYAVQVGAFSDQNNAITLANELTEKGYKAIVKEI